MAAPSPAATTRKTPAASISAPRVSRALVVATTLALVSGVLADYQWAELARAEAGGKLACSLSATIDCAPVWTSAFAKQVRGAVGLPVAALGLAWSITAFLLSFAALARPRPSPAVLGALRVVSLAGLAAVLVFAGVSLSIGVLCPTCLLTYALTIAFGVAVWQGPREAALLPGAGWAAGVVVVVLGLLRVFGGSAPVDTSALPPVATPSASAVAAAKAGGPSPSRAAEPQGDPLPVFVAALAPAQQQALSDALEIFRRAKPADRARFPARGRVGDAFAPVVLTEWTDILCGHCAAFVLGLHDGADRFPRERLAVEPRHYPLDKDCNPAIQGSDGSGTRCAAARALICAEGKPGYSDLQVQLFRSQAGLSAARVLELAAPVVGSAEELTRCMKSPETGRALMEDIEFGTAVGIQGTPHLLINDRPAPPYLPLIVALALASGNPDHPAFASLPAPRPPGP